MYVVTSISFACFIAYSVLSPPCPAPPPGLVVTGFLGDVDAKGVGGALPGRVGGSLVIAGAGDALVGVSLENGSLGACLEGMLGTPGR